MTEMIVLLTATLIVAAILGTIVITLREVFSDGAGHPGNHVPPRSHVPDPFDPRSQHPA